MTKHRWQHRYVWEFPNFRTFKLRMSFVLAFLKLESFQLIALYFCAGELYYRRKSDFYTY